LNGVQHAGAARSGTLGAPNVGSGCGLRHGIPASEPHYIHAHTQHSTHAPWLCFRPGDPADVLDSSPAFGLDDTSVLRSSWTLEPLVPAPPLCIRGWAAISADHTRTHAHTHIHEPVQRYTMHSATLTASAATFSRPPQPNRGPCHGRGLSELTSDTVT
jgi:hypothetical protein